MTSASRSLCNNRRHIHPSRSTSSERACTPCIFYDPVEFKAGSTDLFYGTSLSTDTDHSLALQNVSLCGKKIYYLICWLVYIE